ncbi:O-antigen ligase [Luteitalea sp. TBR-22]|uniref:O-antigen ligase family protein n=1 Tax=Luteitalea sp. TBR-22 TaxID=2802971 RepID=UPI001EF54451|nr:O-antigen ligase family protein [Luteitalea sp. TBR-22]
MLLAGSRFLSRWLAIVGIGMTGGGSAADGSPIDMVAFLVLMTLMAVSLARRNINWPSLLGANWTLCALYAFGLLSITWSADPVVALKRLIKSTGTVAAALVILTDKYPYKALRSVMTSLSVVLLPLSILFIKYYPEIGRQYHSTGAQMMTGVTTQKNSLGELCMLTGLYASWNLLHVRPTGGNNGGRLPWHVALPVLAMVAWLMLLADSATALVCLATATGVHFIGRSPQIASRPTRLALVLAATASSYVILQFGFDINAVLLGLLNRRPDLTTRVPMWEDLLATAANPLVGFGWQSFSLTEQHSRIFERWQVVSVHNTYLDLYLNLGLVGLALYGLVWLRGVWSSVRCLTASYQQGVLRISLLLVVALYGWTETVDLGVSNMYWVLLLAAIDLPILTAPLTARSSMGGAGRQGTTSASSMPPPRVPVNRGSWSKTSRHTSQGGRRPRRAPVEGSAGPVVSTHGARDGQGAPTPEPPAARPEFHRTLAQTGRGEQSARDDRDRTGDIDVEGTKG